jgi:hypothetical protein
VINRFIVTSFSAIVGQRESELAPPQANSRFESGADHSGMRERELETLTQF